jgi:cytoskeletal protein CcmA (bactofilin family)
MITISVGTVMRGNLVTSGSVRLDGRFDGRLICSRLEVTSDGYANGYVSARDIVIAGQIVGRVEARSVTLSDGAFVEGDVRYASIVLESGATMTGKAVRAEADFTPPDLLALEADLDVATAQLDDMERTARDAMAERATAEYPQYEKVRRTLVAAR